MRKPHLFYFGEETIEVVNEYNYLDIVFNYTAKFNVAKQNLYQKGNRAMFSVLKTIKKLSLPVDVAVKLFTHLVKPVILSISPPAQIWCMENKESHL